MKNNNYKGGWISFCSNDQSSQEIINRVIAKMRSESDINLDQQDLLIKDLFLFIEKLINRDNEMCERLENLELDILKLKNK